MCVKDSAFNMWQALKQAYQNQSASNQANLLIRLLTSKMKEDKKLENHLANMETIIADLRTAGVRGMEDEQLLSIIFLMSLPLSYGSAVTAITMMAKEDLRMESVKIRLINHKINQEVVASAAGPSTTQNNTTMLTATGQNMPTKLKKRETKKKRTKKTCENQYKSFHSTRNSCMNRGNFNRHGHGGRPMRHGRGRYLAPQWRPPYQQHANTANCNYYAYQGGYQQPTNQGVPSSTIGGQPQSNLLYIQNQNAQPEQDEFGFIGMLLVNNDFGLQKNNIHYFYIDTGANRFCVIDKHLLSNVRILNRPTLINVNKQGSAIQATKIGSLGVITEKGIKIH